MKKRNYTSILCAAMTIVALSLLSSCGSNSYMIVKSIDYSQFDLPIYEKYYGTNYIIVGQVLVKSNMTVDVKEPDVVASPATYYSRHDVMPVPVEKLIIKMVEEAKKLGAEGIINFEYRYDERDYIQTIIGYAVKWENPAEKY